MNQDDKTKVVRETLSLYPDDWVIVKAVMQQFNLKRSQAMRVILNDYRTRHNLPSPHYPAEVQK